VQRFRCGLVFKAHGLLYHSTLGLRVIKKKKGPTARMLSLMMVTEQDRCCTAATTKPGRVCSWKRSVSGAFRKVDVRLLGKGNSNSHGARPVHLINTMIKWIRTSRLSMKNSLCRGPTARMLSLMMVTISSQSACCSSGFRV